jgi:hypothetical protein
MLGLIRVGQEVYVDGVLRDAIICYPGGPIWELIMAPFIMLFATLGKWHNMPDDKKPTTKEFDYCMVSGLLFDEDMF